MAFLKASLIAAPICSCSVIGAKNNTPEFRVIAFSTAKEDQALISFVHEAERWFPQVAARYNFSFDTRSNWSHLNSDFLSKYQVVVFLDARPEEPAQRAAFQAYMEHGGAWMGFHFAGFALTPPSGDRTRASSRLFAAAERVSHDAVEPRSASSPKRRERGISKGR
jgi:hypothetical protein